ncbi:MAG: threonine aldolase [Solirubrobacteraceae bacterium]|jgi:threonine aldolase|nr:threonine aldolase [Solirubrobacteraceae bacterium]
MAVNLHSDTQTKPTAGMRAAMAAAEVGDEQRMADPTVNALCERVCALLGVEAAVFLPTGTMCNQIALRVHVRPGGDAVFLHRTAHPLIAEAGGPAVVPGAFPVWLPGERGMFDADTLRAALYADGDRYAPRNRLVSLEQTTNVAGGHVWPLEQWRAVQEVAFERGMAVHVDGARLMNAVIASGVPAADWAAGCDSVWIDFTKGLGAPLGAVMGGSAAFIDEAWRYKQMLGGAMRQAGIVAAGALYALDHHVERLAEDHANARRLAEGLAELPGVVIDAAVTTNIVVFEVPDAPAFVAGLDALGVDMLDMGPTTIRAVTHLDVTAADIDTALAAAASVLA